MVLATQILVVCTGNICRSPMGEIVLREKIAAAGIKHIKVISAAVSAEEEGNPIDVRAQKVLREAGYQIPNHKAHKVTVKELQESNLILAMTVGHARILRKMMLDADIDLTKLHLWREYDGTMEYAKDGIFGENKLLENTDATQKRSQYADFIVSDGEYDVPDPWYGGQKDFSDTLTIIERGAAGIISWLSAK